MKKTCFVCQAQFTTYDQMATHIKECHKESVDYVECPSCGAPVRDLRSHYKVLHPETTMPKVQQSRALVWRAHAAGKKPTKKTVWLEGHFWSAKNNRHMHHRSGLELAIYQALELTSNIVSYRVEPFSIRYEFAGKTHLYFPDIEISKTDGSRELWEIKPKNQTNDARNLAKWEAAANYCAAAGLKFKVITEKGVGMLRESAGLPKRLSPK